MEPEPQSQKQTFERELEARLETLRSQGLYRELRPVESPQQTVLRVGGRELLNFSSNDYLGLANEPVLKEAALAALRHFGAGSGASRLICGSLQPHHALEAAAAEFKGTEAALSFSSGYAAVLGTICALLAKDDVMVVDKLVHASIVDAARLCGAKLRVFAHNDLNDLERILQWADRRQPSSRPMNRPVLASSSPSATQGERGPQVEDSRRSHSLSLALPPSKRSRTLIVTESVFSMDGDRAPLQAMVALKEKYGAWLMLDEAHATGLFGPHRRGLAEAEGVSDHIEIQLATLGKAVGASGGCVCGSQTLVDYLVNRARSFIFSTAPAPAAAAAAAAGLRFIQSTAGEARCRCLWERVAQCRRALDLPGEAPSAIIPVLIGAEDQAVEAAANLRGQDLFIPAIRYPTVARGQARLRLTLTASHTAEDISRVAGAVKGYLRQDQTPPSSP